jgi:hypothetical protein
LEFKSFPFRRPRATSVKESEQLELELARYSGTGCSWGIAPLSENWKDSSTGEGARQQVVAEAMPSQDRRELISSNQAFFVVSADDPCHNWQMAKGWKIVTVLPNTKGGAPLQEWSLVAIADKSQAIRAIKARHPHAAIRVDSEADAELLAKYGVLDGKIFVLVEGT